MSEFTEPKNKKKTVVLFSIISIIVLILIAAGGFIIAKASSDNIYEGVWVGRVNLGGMNKSDAIRELAKAYDIDGINVRVRCEDIEFDIYGSEFSLKPDFEATADKALSYGKDGNIFSNSIRLCLLILK